MISEKFFNSARRLEKKQKTYEISKKRVKRFIYLLEALVS